MPKLQQLIKDLFPEVELLNSIPPDEVIPIGAAIEAGILVGKDDLPTDLDSITIECSASDILVKVGFTAVLVAKELSSLLTQTSFHCSSKCIAC